MKSTHPPTIGAESVALWWIVSYFINWLRCLMITNTNIVCLPSLWWLLAVGGAYKVVGGRPWRTIRSSAFDSGMPAVCERSLTWANYTVPQNNARDENKTYDNFLMNTHAQHAHPETPEKDLRSCCLQSHNSSNRVYMHNKYRKWATTIFQKAHNSLRIKTSIIHR